MPGEDLRYIDSLLDLAEKHDVAIRLDPDGQHVHVDGVSRTPAYNYIKKQVIQTLKTNRQMVLWRLTNPAEPEGPLPTGKVSFGEKASIVGKSLLPSTNAGAASMGALTAASIAAPELTLPAEAAIGAGSALLGGQFDPDSSNLGNIATGVATAVAPTVAKMATDLPFAAMSWLQRPGRQSAPELTAAIGKTMQGYLAKIAPKTSAQIAAVAGDLSNRSDKNTISRIINSSTMKRELRNTYRSMIDTSVQAVEQSAQSDLDHLVALYKSKYGAIKSLSQIRQDRDQMKLLRELRNAAHYRHNIGKDIRTIFRGIKTTGRGAFNEGGELKFSTAAAKAGDSREVLEQKLYGILNHTDPSGNLLNMVQTARTAYSQYKGFRTLLRVSNIMDPSGKWFNPIALQRYLDGQTNMTVDLVEDRLKDAFEDLRKVVRRNAPEFDEKGRPIVADQPLFPKAISLGERIPVLGGYIRKSLESPRFLTRQIGAAKPPLKGAPDIIQRWMKPASTIATGEALNPPQGEQ